jgi:hypothetical protein
MKTKEEEIEEMINNLANERSKLLNRNRRFNDEVGDDALIKALKGENKYVRRLAQFALKGFEEPVLEPLKAGLKGVLLESLIEDLGSLDQDKRSKAMVALGSRGEGAVNALITALEHEDWLVKAGATLALGMMGEEAVNPLILALKGGDLDKRQRAARALGWIGHPKAIPPLITALNDKNNHIQREAANALATIGGEKSKSALSQFLNKKDKPGLIPKLKVIIHKLF